MKKEGKKKEGKKIRSQEDKKARREG